MQKCVEIDDQEYSTQLGSNCDRIDILQCSYFEHVYIEQSFCKDYNIERSIIFP